MGKTIKGFFVLLQFCLLGLAVSSCSGNDASADMVVRGYEFHGDGAFGKLPYYIAKYFDCAARVVGEDVVSQHALNDEEKRLVADSISSEIRDGVRQEVEALNSKNFKVSLIPDGREARLYVGASYIDSISGSVSDIFFSAHIEGALDDKTYKVIFRDKNEKPVLDAGIAITNADQAEPLVNIAWPPVYNNDVETNFCQMKALDDTYSIDFIDCTFSDIDEIVEEIKARDKAMMAEKSKQKPEAEPETPTLKEGIFGSAPDLGDKLSLAMANAAYNERETIGKQVISDEVLSQLRNEVVGKYIYTEDEVGKLRGFAYISQIWLSDNYGMLNYVISVPADVENIPSEDPWLAVCDKEGKILQAGKPYYGENTVNLRQTLSYFSMTSTFDKCVLLSEQSAFFDLMKTAAQVRYVKKSEVDKDASMSKRVKELAPLFYTHAKNETSK